MSSISYQIRTGFDKRNPGNYLPSSSTSRPNTARSTRSGNAHSAAGKSPPSRQIRRTVCALPPLSTSLCGGCVKVATRPSMSRWASASSSRNYPICRGWSPAVPAPGRAVGHRKLVRLTVVVASARSWGSASNDSDWVHSRLSRCVCQCSGVRARHRGQARVSWSRPGALSTGSVRLVMRRPSSMPLQTRGTARVRPGRVSIISDLSWKKEQQILVARFSASGRKVPATAANPRGHSRPTPMSEVPHGGSVTSSAESTPPGAGPGTPLPRMVAAIRKAEPDCFSGRSSAWGEADPPPAPSSRCSSAQAD